MKTINIKLYSLNELRENAREKALADLYGINVDYGWWDFAYDDFIAIAKTIGIAADPKQMNFRGFYAQGDGSSFSARVDIAQMIPAIQQQDWKNHAPDLELAIATPELDRRVLKLIANGQLDITATIKQNSRGYNVTASLSELSYNGHCLTRIEAELEQLERDLQVIAETLNQYLFTSLRDEYDYQTSEEAIIATIEANGYWFTADGKIATQIERLANEELIKS